MLLPLPITTHDELLADVQVCVVGVVTHVWPEDEPLVDAEFPLQIALPSMITHA